MNKFWLWRVVAPDRGRVRPASWRTPGGARRRGTSGLGWPRLERGCDWAAVVVVTGRRRRSRQTVPGAAWSPIASHPLLFPGFPTRRNRWPTASPMASVPVRTGWKRLSGAGSAGCGAAPAPGGRWRQVSAAGSATSSPSPRAPASPPVLPGRRERPALAGLGTEPLQAPCLRNSPRLPWSACVRITARFLKSAAARAPRASVPARRRGAREPALPARCPGGAHRGWCGLWGDRAARGRFPDGPRGRAPRAPPPLPPSWGSAPAFTPWHLSFPGGPCSGALSEGPQSCHHLRGL